jgi:hypothetical protein
MEMTGACVIIDDPEDALPQRAFMMEIRGDVKASAQRHVHLFAQLVHGGFVRIGEEVLG